MTTCECFYPIVPGGMASVSAMPDGEPTVVWMTGEHDLSSVGVLFAALDRAVAFDRGDLVIDLSRVEFMDASTIRVLVQVQHCLWVRHRCLSLRAPSRCARRLLDLCGLRLLVDEGASDGSGWGHELPGWIEVDTTDGQHDMGATFCPALVRAIANWTASDVAPDGPCPSVLAAAQHLGPVDGADARDGLRLGVTDVATLSVQVRRTPVGFHGDRLGTAVAWLVVLTDIAHRDVSIAALVHEGEYRRQPSESLEVEWAHYAARISAPLHRSRRFRWRRRPANWIDRAALTACQRQILALSLAGFEPHETASLVGTTRATVLHQLRVSLSALASANERTSLGRPTDPTIRVDQPDRQSPVRTVP